MRVFLKIRLLLLISAFGFCFQAYSQKPNLYFEQVLDGLSQSNVRCIAQDGYGFLWLGTMGGLNRFDGQHFKAYRSGDDAVSLNDNRINDLLIDRNGRLWVGTYEDLHLFDYGQDKFQIIKPKEARFSTTDVLTIQQLADGTIWVGSLHGVLELEEVGEVHLKKPEAKNLKLVEDRAIHVIHEAQDGVIWLGTDDGVFIISEGETVEVALSQRLSNVTDILDVEGEIWISTRYDGLYHLHFTGGRWTASPLGQEAGELNSNNIFDLQLKDNLLWIGTETGGLNVLDLEGGSWYHYDKKVGSSGGLQTNSIWSIFFDSEDGLWLGTNNQGVFTHNRYAKKFNHVLPVTPNKVQLQFGTVSDFLEVDDRMWIATDGGGISIWNRSENEFSFINHVDGDPSSLASSEVLSLFEDSKGRIWIGQWGGGLSLFDPSSKRVQNFNRGNNHDIGSDNVFNIVEDESGCLWMPTWGHGLSRFNPETEEFFNIGHIQYSDSLLSSELTYDVEIDGAGRIWVATLMGLDRVTIYEDDRFEIRQFKSDDDLSSSLPSSSINCLQLDSQERLWVGTDKGLSVYQEEGSIFDSFTTTHGLPSNNIRGIVEDDMGILWITTDHGIAKMVEGDKVRFEMFETFDGLQGNEFFGRSVYKDSNGELFMGGVNGFNHFFPEQIALNPIAPQVQLTGLRIFNQLVSPASDDATLEQTILETDLITLRHDQSVFSIEYQAISYVNPTEIKYAFRLSGLEPDWNFVEERKVATYTNLDPGEYTFQVKAANSDGVWSEGFRELRISILPPWWETLWARGLAVFVFLSSIFSFFYYRTRNLRRQQQLLELEVKKQTQELIVKNEAIASQSQDLQLANDELNELNKFKESMTGMIVHDLKNPLNVILGLSGDGAYPNMKEINASGRSMHRIVSNILDIQRLEAVAFKLNRERISLRTTLDKAIEEVNYLLLSKNMSAKVLLQGDWRIEVDPDIVHRVFVNLLANAIKYSDVNTLISITGELVDDRVKVHFQDQGRGIPKDNLSQIFDRFWKGDHKSELGSTGLGLAFCKLAVQAHGGDISIKSEEGKGSVFSLDLPLAGDGIIDNDSETVVNSTNLELSEQDQLVLRPVALKLTNIPFHRASDIYQELEALPTDRPNISNWIVMLKDAIHNWNREQFHSLIDMTR